MTLGQSLDKRLQEHNIYIDKTLLEKEEFITKILEMLKKEED